MSKALYRTYRPVKLDDVVGQDSVVASLKEALKRGKLSHAYLFTGPRGCGKTSVARIFAHTINGFKYELEDSYVDIIEIDAASNRGIDNIRELREKAVIAPTAGKYKVYIIDEVHMLTKEAFNALLKLLEEPPAHVVFILATTDPQKIPVTILSRAQNFTFKLAAPEVMQAHLAKIAEQEDIKITPDALQIVVRRGGGSFRDSISLLDQLSTLTDQEITADAVTAALGLPQDQQVERLLAAHQAGDSATVTATLKDLMNSGVKAESLVTELIERLLAAPLDPTGFALLATLPSVQPPFAEAKLLTTLLSGDFSQGPRGTESTAPAVAGPSLLRARRNSASAPETLNEVAAPRALNVSSESVSRAGKLPAREGATRKDGLATGLDEESIQKSESVSSGPFSWADFVAAIQASSPTIGNYIAKSTYEATATALTIHPANKIAVKILSAPANKSLLAAHAQGLEVSIQDPASPASKNPKLADISAIMGNIQELNQDAANPFA